jgi:hypothetical protein
MSTITLRATKGSPLTNTEVDNNFSNLNTDKIEATYAGAMNSLTGGSAITTVSSTTGITTGAWKATVISPTYGGTGVAQASAASTITLGGALTMSGAYTFTGTLTGTTAVTFPTSGTLATTNGTFTGTWNGGVIAPNYGGTGVANNVANTLTFTGAYSLGLTLSANTAVTLPTTGTLATLAGAESLTNKKLGSLTSNGLVTTSGGDGTLSVTTTLGVATGGTGLTSLTAGYIPYGNGTSALASSSNLSFDGTNLTIGGASTAGTFIKAKGLGTPGNDGIYMDFSAPNGRIVAVNSSGAPSSNLILSVHNGTAVTEGLRIRYTGALSLGSSGTAYGTSGQLLQSNGDAAPTWVTPTYASTGKAIAMAMVFGG